MSLVKAVQVQSASPELGESKVPLNNLIEWLDYHDMQLTTKPPSTLGLLLGCGDLQDISILHSSLAVRWVH